MIRLTSISWMVTMIISSSITNVIAQTLVKSHEKHGIHLNKFRSDYCKSLLERKPALLQTYYADSVRLMPSFQKMILGKGNAMLYYKAFSERFTIQDIKRNEFEILDLGMQVLETGAFNMKLVAKRTGKEYLLVGKYLNLWQELKNGDLHLLTEAWNYDQYYGEVHDQLKFEEIPAIYAAFQPNVVVNNSYMRWIEGRCCK